MAFKILFSGTTTTGVEVTTAGTYGNPSLNFTLSGSKEVILSVGAFQSPQFLMVSGIGPSETLQRHHVPIIKHFSGVGQNMWDHTMFGTDHRVNVLTASNSINHPAAAAAAQAFLVNATGPLSIFGSGYYGWEKLPSPYHEKLSPAALANLSEAFTPDWPELEWLPENGYQGYAANKQKSDPMDGYNYATINTAIVSPTSRGTVSIQSADMLVPPLIDPQYFTTQTDVELAIQAFKRQREAWAYIDSQGLTIGEVILPGLNVTSDLEILDYIARSTIEIYHAAATNKMGMANDTMAVVDSKCRVFSMQGLRVVDVSAFPFLPPGHPQSTVYALAEKIADDILKGW